MNLTSSDHAFCERSFPSLNFVKNMVSHPSDISESAIYITTPALEAIRGQSSAASFATGPVIAEPFISPFGFTMTPALSSKYR